MSDASGGPPAVYVQTNDQTPNAVLAFARLEDGRLAAAGRFETGGRGTGEPHLASQSSLVLSDDGAWLLVVNAGSDELSLFDVQDDGLRLADCVASGGGAPTSVAVHGTLVYVLNSATSSIAGFRIQDGRLVELEGSARPLSGADADPAQIAFSADGSDAGRDRARDRQHQLLRGRRARARRRPDDDRRVRQDPLRIRLHGRRRRDRHGGVRRRARRRGGLVVRAHRAGPPVAGQRLRRRHPQRGLLGRRDQRRPLRVRHELRRRDDLQLRDRGGRQHRAARPGGRRDPAGEKGIRDEAITRDGRYLYAIDTDAQRLFGWRVSDSGELASIGAFEGVPDTVAGLAAGSAVAA